MSLSQLLAISPSMPVRAPVGMQCLRHSIQQMERRREGEGRTEIERGGGGKSYMSFLYQH